MLFSTANVASKRSLIQAGAPDLQHLLTLEILPPKKWDLVFKGTFYDRI